MIYYHCIISRKYLNIKLLNIYYYLINIDISQVNQDLLSLFPIPILFKKLKIFTSCIDDFYNLVITVLEILVHRN
jgi:hypothetical protein